MREGPGEGQGREETVTDRDTERWRHKGRETRKERNGDPQKDQMKLREGDTRGESQRWRVLQRRKGREGETRGRLRETETERQIEKGRKKRNEWVPERGGVPSTGDSLGF